MTDALNIALAQLNLIVGDLSGNSRKILKACVAAGKEGADLVVFPELCITGYPPEDLVLKPEFQKAACAEVERLVGELSAEDPAVLIGAPWVEDGKLYNAALLIADGAIQAVQYKHDLPNYGVFDEKRVFAVGPLPEPVVFKGVKLGIFICEDMWQDKVMGALKDADILISINASPFEVGKHKKRVERASAAVEATGRPVVYVNQLCGQDDLVFDGDSFVLSAMKQVMLRLSRSEEAVVTAQWENIEGAWRVAPGESKEYDCEEEVVYLAMMLGLRDYVEKNGFPGVLIGLSGGIDSALTAAVAVDALGKDRVQLYMLPSRYTSEESTRDAAEIANNLGVELYTIPIEPMLRAADASLEPFFHGVEENVTEENIQSRIRGLLLMALSNKFGWMVVATGNKSEMATGYATLYGDMCGGYSVLKDVYKTQVYALSTWRNVHVPEVGAGPSGEVIPSNIITKAPTAELRHGQTDQDSLPPYDVLDAVLYQLIEERKGIQEIVDSGHAADMVKKVYRLVHAAEYKRRQSAPGVKVSQRPFGRDRRYPITNKFAS